MSTLIIQEQLVRVVVCAYLLFFFFFPQRGHLSSILTTCQFPRLPQISQFSIVLV